MIETFNDKYQNASYEILFDQLPSPYTGDSELKYVWVDEDNAYTTEIFDPEKIYTLNNIIDEFPKSTNIDVIVYIFEGHMTSSFDIRCR